MPSAIIYGHSQAQPTGMGDQMLEQLKARGWDVKRVGLQSRNDAGLLNEVDVLGDVSKADKVFLYCAGNSDVPQWEDTLALINYFGASRVIAIFPPINLDKGEQSVNAAMYRRQANLAGLNGIVPVYFTEGRDPDFKPDRTHMLPNSKPCVDLTTQILEEQLDGKVQGEDSSVLAIVALAAVAGAAFALWRRQR